MHNLSRMQSISPLNWVQGTGDSQPIITTTEGA
jgi:hypothetical protein